MTLESYVSMKYSRWIGICAAFVLIISCYLPWTYYPDLGEGFTGFYSKANMYGKPGIAFFFLAALSIVLFAIPKIWAVRANILLAAMIVAYTVKTFILFTGCYGGICPDKKIGIYLLVLSVAMIMLTSILPGLGLEGEKE
jgi:hypothetical protein